MIAVIQRVSRASVEIKGSPETKVAIGRGYAVLVGIKKGDTETERDFLVRKILDLRLFENELGKLDYSIVKTGGEILLIPQFTLLADINRGTRPDFSQAEPPALAKKKFEDFCSAVKAQYEKVKTGFFGENMLLDIENDGPVTIIAEK